MNKKIKIIIAVCVIIVVAVSVGILSWGLQPVNDKVSLQELNKKLDGRYIVPLDMPFELDVIECYVNYKNEPAIRNKRTRFEAKTNDITGYSIRINDFEMGREIMIDTVSVSRLNDESLAPVVSMGNYNNQPVYYFSLEIEKFSSNWWYFEFESNGRVYEIDAVYDKDIDNAILKSDIEFLLNQMI